MAIAWSCDQTYSSSSVPECTWTDEEDISVDPVALKIPSGMGSYFVSQAPSDGVFRTLTHPLWRGNASLLNKGRIFGDLNF